MSESQWIRCPKCGKKLAKVNNGVLEIKKGDRAARIYNAICVALDCERCGTTLDLPRKLPVLRGLR